MSEDNEAKAIDLRHQEEMAHYQGFLEHRKMLHDALIVVTGRFTQWSITLAGGALALSMTYLEKINPEPLGGSWVLVSAWILLGGSLVSSLTSLHLSAKATERAIVDHDQAYRDSIFDKNSRPINPPNGFTIWTRRLSAASVLLFALGIVFLSVFVALCPPSNHKPNKDHVKTTTTTTTAIPPATTEPAKGAGR